jgi:hypothetical protein
MKIDRSANWCERLRRAGKIVTLYDLIERGGEGRRGTLRDRKLLTRANSPKAPGQKSMTNTFAM